MMTETFGGKKYRKMSGRRYAYWQKHMPSESERGDIIVQLDAFARVMALCLVDDVGGWVVSIEDIEEKVNEILEDWPVEEVLKVGGEQLLEFNNFGVKIQETIEGNS